MTDNDNTLPEQNGKILRLKLIYLFVVHFKVYFRKLAMQKCGFFMIFRWRSELNIQTSTAGKPSRCCKRRKLRCPFQ